MNKPFTYLSVCSGMEAASVAWHPLGWTPAGFSEIEPFPSAILKHRFPNTKNYGNLTQYTEWQIEPNSIDLLVGGTPCQSFSVAGLRKGIADPRGNLALTFLGLADRLKPRWIVWENVPGVLSSNKGRDFASFLGALAQLGYGFAYRVLDAQYFGVAQRRRRVFVVAHFGDWRPAAEVLFEPESLRRDIKKGRKKGQGTATSVEESVGGDGKFFDKQAIGQYGQQGIASTCAARDYKDATDLIVEQKLYENRPSDSRITGPHDVSPTVVSRFGTGGGNVPLVNNEQVAIPIHDQATRHTGKRGDKEDGKGNGLGIGNNGDPMNTLTQGDRHAVGQVVAFDAYNQTVSDKSQTLSCSASDVNHTGAVYSPTMAVRRLTPVECERLQGFPDNWSRIPWKGKSEEQCPDGPRYKACGNSMAVPVMRHIGERIQNFNNKTK